jgi:predicted DNA-binding protein
LASERYEIRLDKEHRARLGELAATYGVPGSALVRDMIDRLYEDEQRKRRVEAVKRLSQLDAEDVPDMATLRRQLGRSRDVL